MWAAKNITFKGGGHLFLSLALLSTKDLAPWPFFKMLKTASQDPMKGDMAQCGIFWVQ